jgi:hypothetical protein
LALFGGEAKSQTGHEAPLGFLRLRRIFFAVALGLRMQGGSMYAETRSEQFRLAAVDEPLRM